MLLVVNEDVEMRPNDLPTTLTFATIWNLKKEFITSAKCPVRRNEVNKKLQLLKFHNFKVEGTKKETNKNYQYRSIKISGLGPGEI